MFTKKLTIALALCGSLAGVGVAADEGFHGGAGRAQIMQKYDLNKDGKLDDGEKLAMRDARAAQAFQKLDANGDGVLSLDEFKAGKAQMGRHARGRFHHGMHRGISKP